MISRGKPVSAVAGHAVTLPAGGQVDNVLHADSVGSVPRTLPDDRLPQSFREVVPVRSIPVTCGLYANPVLQFLVLKDHVVLDGQARSVPCFAGAPKHGVCNGNVHKGQADRIEVDRVYPGFPTLFWGLSGFFVNDLMGKALWSSWKTRSVFQGAVGAFCASTAPSASTGPICMRQDRRVLGLQSTRE